MPELTFFERHQEWLEQQPEWPLLLASPRNIRRATARQVGYGVLTIPPVLSNSPNRKTKRAAMRDFRHNGLLHVASMGARAKRREAKAKRDRTRYQRVSARRYQDLMGAKHAQALLDDAELATTQVEETA